MPVLHVTPRLRTLAFACKDKSCAPPPVGTGGSTGGKSVHPDTAAFRAADKVRVESLSKVEAMSDADARSALAFYTGSAYIEVNGQLRGTIGVDESVTNLIDEIDRAFESAAVTTTEPIVVHRSVEMNDELRSVLTPGTEFTDKGFVSTSTNRRNVLQQTDEFATMRIVVPKGARVLAGNDDENELIINRGSRFRVGKVNRWVDSDLIAHVDVDLELVQ